MMVWIFPYISLIMTFDLPHWSVPSEILLYVQILSLQPHQTPLTWDTGQDVRGLHPLCHPPLHSNQSQSFQFLVLEGEEDQVSHWLNVEKLVSVNVGWLSLTCKIEMDGESMFNIICCCQPHRIGSGQHPNLQMNMDGRMITLNHE